MAKRARHNVPEGLHCYHHIEEWREENQACFSPPICNKLMFKEQLNVMFVGGPNKREDFHLDEGSEFFFQLKGNMELPTIQKGKRKHIKIREGQVFLLPSRVPHSPQRPQEGSFGLVIERSRPDNEIDGLRWYTDFTKCEDILYEKFFHCGDLGRDLVPVVVAYKQSEEFKTGIPGKNITPAEQRPIKQNFVDEIPAPFFLEDFLTANAEKLASGGMLNLFGDDHPDKEFKIAIAGGPSNQQSQVHFHDTWLYQVKGNAQVTVKGGTLKLEEGCAVIVKPNVVYDVSRDAGSIGMVVTNDPMANKPKA